MDELENDLVEEMFACPECGERRADYLTWIMDHVVKCSSCGTEYNPMNGARYDIGAYPDKSILYEDDVDDMEYGFVVVEHGMTKAGKLGE